MGPVEMATKRRKKVEIFLPFVLLVSCGFLLRFGASAGTLVSVRRDFGH